MPKIRILVVEDESLVARDIQNMLRSLGYEVTGIVASGEQAIKNASASVPDLVLMDIVLKGDIDGIAAAEKLWEEYGIPVIYLTAYADDTTFERAKLTKPFGYLLKPFEERELQTTIEIALYKSKMEMRLRDREQWLSTILRSIGDGIIAADARGRIEFMNPLAERLTGWSQEQALEKPLGEVLTAGAASMGGAGEEARLVAVEEILASRNGETVPIELTSAPIVDGKKGPRGNVYVFRDITRRKESENRLRRALEGVVQAMSVTVEMRDPYTAGHQRRVSRLSVAIAREMGLPEPQIEGIRMAGEIHDIGKIYVPAEILSKPAKLTDIEFTIIKTHPQVGYDILKNVEFPWPIADIVIQHHERLDGSGYPAGLKGDAILLEARIITVADVVEAMSSHRPYRPSHGIDKALEEIALNKGILYDTAVVEACLRLFNEKGFSLE
ncbi:MAG TPA: HD domain-containing phosphohydrolase [Acidobacteriota bacterium]|nr:HD domain-containing phosphohydrolase [Acidobacteriota bacterium]